MRELETALKVILLTGCVGITLGMLANIVIAIVTRDSPAVAFYAITTVLTGAASIWLERRSTKGGK